MNRYRRITNFTEDRKRGVGSSDIPTLVGLNKRYGQTPLTLWREKTGREAGFDGNERTEWGNYLEPLILRKFVSDRYGTDTGQMFYRNATRADPVSYNTPNVSLSVKTECWHPKYPFAMAHADLIVEPMAITMGTDGERYDTSGTTFLVEAKSTGLMAGKRREGQTSFEGYAEDDDSQHGIPDKVFLQTQWQLFCYGLTEAFVAVLIDTARYKVYGPIVADPKTQEKCLALAERFWWHVEHDKEPQPTTWDDVVSLNPVLADTTASVGGDTEMEVRAMIDEDAKAKARIKELEDRRDDIKNAIGILIGGNSVLTSTGGDVLAKAAERSRETLWLLGETAKFKKLAELTHDEQELLDIEARLRDKGLVKVSRWREVRY